MNVCQESDESKGSTYYRLGASVSSGTKKRRELIRQVTREHVTPWARPNMVPHFSESDLGGVTWRVPFSFQSKCDFPFMFFFLFSLRN